MKKGKNWGLLIVGMVVLTILCGCQSIRKTKIGEAVPTKTVGDMETFKAHMEGKDFYVQ